MSMTDEKVKRINELYHKAKAEGLTETEKKEQALLREEYIASFRKNLRSQLNQIDIPVSYTHLTLPTICSV